MKLFCNVEIHNRRTASLAIKSRGAKIATLALCHKTKPTSEQPNDQDVFLIVCMQLNTSARKYQVYNNIEKLFTKFMNEGKATVRFKEPAEDVIISKADPLQLKGLIRGISLTMVGQGSGKIHLSPAPMKVDRPKKKLTILHRKDYPLKSSSFPGSLTWLQVSDCNLRKIERRVLQLQHLQLLNLSNNCINLLPLPLGDLRITELVLNHNDISVFPDELARGILGQTLQVLDLSFNKISKLSHYFCLMKNIRILSLKSNNLYELPRNIQSLESLRMFNASHNHIKVLPFGIRKLLLDTLDLYQNPLNADFVLQPSIPWQVRSLMECAASSVVHNKVPFLFEDLPAHLNEFVIAKSPCPCGRRVFKHDSACILALDLHKLASTVVYVNNTSHFQVPLEVFFCSAKCWNNKKLPL